MVTKKAPSRKHVAKKVVVRRSTRVSRAPVEESAIPAMVEALDDVYVLPEVGHQKLVRDSFTIPEAEYQLLALLKERLLLLARPTKKSELLRAGVAALALMPDAELLKAVIRVPSLKTGRPKKSKDSKKKS